MEQPLRTHLTRDLIRPRDGIVHSLESSGLGIELSEESTNRYEVH
jgi:L-alanine-DL-glutamate epimerase-like enolase superfamily enzyme